MKDIHEVKDNLPLSFNHVCCRGVAARAGSVHLIYSMDRKLGRNGGGKTHPQQHHPVPQGGPFSNKFWPTTEVYNGDSTGQHQNDVDDIPWHPHHNHTTHFLRKSTSNNQQPFDSLSSSQTVPGIPPVSSTSLTDWTGL